LPLKITVGPIIEFFEGFGSLAFKNVFIEQLGGEHSGRALVVFEDEQFARDAKEHKDLKELAGSEVCLLDHTDADFKKLLENKEDQKENQKSKEKEK